MKVASTLFLITTYLIIFTFNSPVEAQQAGEEYKYSAALTANEPFSISSRSVPDWMNCEVITGENVYELCLQKKVADASVKSAEISYWQAWIGILALLSAIAAAIFSGFAAREASKGVAVALKIGIAEVRPYISASISLNKNEEAWEENRKDKMYQVAYSVNNIGKSEAFICDIHIKFDTTDQAKEIVEDIFEFDPSVKPDDNLTFKLINDLLGNNMYLHPNDEPTIVTLKIENKMIDEVIFRKHDFIFALSVDYKDSLGTKYRSSYGYRARFKKLPSGDWPYELTKHSPIKFQQNYILEDPKIGIGER